VAGGTLIQAALTSAPMAVTNTNLRFFGTEDGDLIVVQADGVAPTVEE
jgi:hypothetical protein